MLRKRINANRYYALTLRLSKYHSANNILPLTVDLTNGYKDQMFGNHDEKLVAIKLKYDPANVFNKWGDITAAAVDQNHGYNSLNIKPQQALVE